VQELRTKYGLPAYTFKKDFDFSKPIEGRGVNKYGETLKMKHQKSEINEIAVLVGDYPSVNDPAAQKALKKIKSLEPDALKIKDGKTTSQSLAALRTIQKAIAPKDSEQKKKGPMGHAMVITNPLLPPEYYAPKGIDKLVMEMNKNVTHSLLDCKARYTVRVATFTGHAILLDQKNQESLERGKKPKSWLEDAAKNAHVLCEVLRARGFEAYEFHDRASSIVTVGSFKSVGTPRPDGKIEINPEVYKIMKTFGAAQVEAGKSTPDVGKPKSVAGIPFDVQPMPVEVPQRMLSSDYASAQ
jgi:hypothetical protein